MRTLFTISLMLAISLTASLGRPHVANATETTVVSFDGLWWQSMTRSEKLVTVQGMLVGFDSGYDIAAGKASDATEGTSGTKFYNSLKDDAPDGTDYTFREIIDHIDSVYTRHPSLKKTLVWHFVACAISKNFDCEKKARAMMP